MERMGGDPKKLTYPDNLDGNGPGAPTTLTTGRPAVPAGPIGHGLWQGWAVRPSRGSLPDRYAAAAYDQFVARGAQRLPTVGSLSSVAAAIGASRSQLYRHWETAADLDAGGAAGRALITTGVPDTAELAAAIDRETVLVFSVQSADPIDLVRVGIASERAWLAAVDARLSASVLTYPLRVEDSAARLAERMDLDCLPQLIMRIGF